MIKVNLVEVGTFYQAKEDKMVWIKTNYNFENPGEAKEVDSNFGIDGSRGSRIQDGREGKTSTPVSNSVEKKIILETDKDGETMNEDNKLILKDGTIV